MYGGSLLALDLRTLECSPIIQDSREFNKVRWAANGDLMVEVSPFGDEDPNGHRRVTLHAPVLSELVKTPASLPDGGEDFQFDWHEARQARAVRTLAAIAALRELAHGHYEVRTQVWDVDVSDAGVVTDCLADVAAEQWDTSGLRTMHVGTESAGGQIAVQENRVIAWSVPTALLRRIGARLGATPWESARD